MKKTLLFFVTLLSLSQPLPAEDVQNTIQKADDITYDWLVYYGEITGVTDHISHLKMILKKLKVRNFLEFGMGFSTKYFLDNCSKVVSVELITDGCGPEWMKRCLNLYKNYANWIPIAYFSSYQGDTTWAKYKYMGSEALAKAAYYQCVNHKNYALINDFYLIEMNSFISNLLKSHKIEVAFVDPGTPLRGDIVQLLFTKVPVIVVHHSFSRYTMEKDDFYGYCRVVKPENYEEIFIAQGLGLTVWVLKDEKYHSFIQDLKHYVNGV